MGMCVTSGAQLMCSFGVAPSSLVVLPAKKTLCGAPAATILDNIPMTNIMPFSMCTSLANPTVAAATSAALGVLTPQPCIPVPAGPWMPGATATLIGNTPALESNSKLMCAYAGVIQVINPGQTKTIIGK